MATTKTPRKRTTRKKVEVPAALEAAIKQAAAVEIVPSTEMPAIQKSPPAHPLSNGNGASSHALSHGDISQRAFFIYLARGCEDGHDIDDWLEAERDLERASA